MIDIFKLGYIVYRLNFVFQYVSPEKENEIINYFVNYNNTWSAASSKAGMILLLQYLLKIQMNFMLFMKKH